MLYPGWKDDPERIARFAKPLESEGFKPIVQPARWDDFSETSSQKTQRIQDELKVICDQFQQPIFVGAMSATGHKVIEAAHDLPHHVMGIFAVAAFLVPHKKSFAIKTALRLGIRGILEFVESTEHFAREILPWLSPDQKQTMASFYGTCDYVVPPVTSVLEGANNYQLSSNPFTPINHLANIANALKSPELLGFLQRFSPI